MGVCGCGDGISCGCGALCSLSGEVLCSIVSLLLCSSIGGCSLVLFFRMGAGGLRIETKELDSCSVRVELEDAVELENEVEGAWPEETEHEREEEEKVQAEGENIEDEVEAG